jgi:hypothetical protein
MVNDVAAVGVAVQTPLMAVQLPVPPVILMVGVTVAPRFVQSPNWWVEVNDTGLALDAAVTVTVETILDRAEQT